MQKRPTPLAQLSPIPVVRLVPTANEMAAHLLAYLLLLAGAFYLASGNPPAWARPLEPLASLQELFGQLLLPLAGASVYYGLKSTFAGWANPGMARLSTVLAALALLVLLALLLREMGQRWRQMQIQQAQGTRPAAHQIPARRSARPSQVK